MHVGAVTVFAADGALDMPRVTRYIEAVLDQMPRYRQRLHNVPLLGHPVWIDHDQFDIGDHVVKVDIGPDATDEALFRMAGRAYSTPLDRKRPLWKVWLVTGLRDRRSAAVFKVHHCMMDGVAGVGLLEHLLRGVASSELPPASTWSPRPAPSRRALVAAELRHRGTRLRDLTAKLFAATRSASSRSAARNTALSIIDAVAKGVTAAPETPLNPDQVGLERRYIGCRVDLVRIKQVKNALGGTVNDVVLAMVTGALRRQLMRCHVDPASVDGFRAMIPMNLRDPAQEGGLGNQVAMLLAELAIAEADPKARLARIREVTREMKYESGQADASRLVEALADATTSSVVTNMVRMTVARRAFNVVITNVPGPPFDLYLLGARMEAIYPLVNLYRNQSLGFALFSYAGTMYCGIQGDRDSAPDLETVAADVCAELDALCEAAGAGGTNRAVAS